MLSIALGVALALIGTSTPAIFPLTFENVCNTVAPIGVRDLELPENSSRLDPSNAKFFHEGAPMERPAGVTILAVLAFFLAGFLVLAGLGALLGGAVLSHMAASGGLKMLAGVGAAILGAIFLGFAVIYIVDAIGLLKMANWARILTIILVALSLFHSAFRLFRSLVHLHPIAVFFTLVIAAIDVWILVYLFKPEVKQAFGATSF